ncbi:MAG: malto-oligosyltrehalose trehalohydrolase [Candidatus Aminicenantes bacterium]|jgi:maltooligosyltrehalose trehalohydrolase
MEVGALYLDKKRCQFVVWAPFLNKLSLRILSPHERIISMDRNGRGYWKVILDGVEPGTRYVYRLDEGKDRPDPASFFQPEGVHGCSQVVDHRWHPWKDHNWPGVPLPEMILYELHVGAFTPEGNFEGVIKRLDELCDLGINAVDIMPVAQFPGERNWGYDGVYPFAVQNSYGGPERLKQLVDACHKRHIAVILDVVYNHLGPEGNYLRDFGPYFTSKHLTPWGEAVNFDSAYSDEVRNFFIENALHWFRHYHIDGLRLDAVHTIYDASAKLFLQELSERVEAFSQKSGRKFYLIAESDLNDVRVITPRELGGVGLDAQWCDDFHHSLHAFLTGEKEGYYADFGRLDQFAKSQKEGYVLSWQYSVYRKRHHGSSSRDRPSHQFIVFCQNHDQVGNRMLGERLSSLVSFEGLKLAAGAVLLSPFVPLLFMGEEYAEEAPFLYFVSHSDPDLISSVREGRRREFQAFLWEEEPPDPQSPHTFRTCRLRWEKKKKNKQRVMWEFYQRLIDVRKKIPALSHLEKKNLEIEEWNNKNALFIRRWHQKSQIVILMNFNQNDTHMGLTFSTGRWRKVLESSHQKWMGPGESLPEIVENSCQLTLRTLSFALYEREENR